MKRKRINATIGYRENVGGKMHYYGGHTGQGMCYKDMEAWVRGRGVIYISDNCLENQGKGGLWCRTNWLKFVHDAIFYYSMQVSSDDKFVEYIAENALHACDWQDLTTYVSELEYSESWVVRYALWYVEYKRKLQCEYDEREFIEYIDSKWNDKINIDRLIDDFEFEHHETGKSKR